LFEVILEESSPEELQIVSQATVRSSVLEVLLEITKFCDLYLMERVLDDESEVRTNFMENSILSSFLIYCKISLFLLIFVFHGTSEQGFICIVYMPLYT
jgi:hypothetical protein